MSNNVGDTLKSISKFLFISDIFILIFLILSGGLDEFFTVYLYLGNSVSDDFIRLLIILIYFFISYVKYLLLYGYGVLISNSCESIELQEELNDTLMSLKKYLVTGIDED